MLKRFFKKGLIEAGCDEAGRGCLAGPVFAASVILPAGFSHALLNDSKQVVEEDRNTLRPIIERKAIVDLYNLVRGLNTNQYIKCHLIVPNLRNAGIPW